ncbi:MAG: hypothetical protein AAF587_41415 [Bacteroidota bacterium]
MENQHFNDIARQFAEEYGSSSGHMFGKACLKINNKAFVALFKGEMVFKLGRQAIESLRETYPESVNWDPSGKGRAMKDWLQLPIAYEADWSMLAKQSLEFVRATL